MGRLDATGVSTDERDDAVAWVRGRFTDPGTNVMDERVLARATSDPDFAIQLREMMEAPCMGPLYRFDVGPPGEMARANPLSLERLNARLSLIGAHAIPFEGETSHGPMRIWTVRAPYSHMRVVRGIAGWPLCAERVAGYRVTSDESDAVKGGHAVHRQVQDGSVGHGP